MKKQRSAVSLFISVIAFSLCGNLAAGQPDATASLDQLAEGLWFYTGLTSSDGQEMPLAGAFLFKDGVFIQHAVFEGEPIGEQRAMAHFGPYSAGPEFIHLIAEQTISTAPGDSPPLSSQGRTEHDVTVSRTGDEMRLVFSKGTGTIQDFVRGGPGEGQLYSLLSGALAFVDGQFILVQGDEKSVVAGYGSFEKDGDALSLNVTRWTEADQSTATNLADTTMHATFDGHSLTLEDGRSFQVMP